MGREAGPHKYSYGIPQGDLEQSAVSARGAKWPGDGCQPASQGDWPVEHCDYETLG